MSKSIETVVIYVGNLASAFGNDTRAEQRAKVAAALLADDLQGRFEVVIREGRSHVHYDQPWLVALDENDVRVDVGPEFLDWEVMDAISLA